MPKKTTIKPSFPVRPPIVTIMGHVDHGKTTLLDTIRKTKVAASEHGGITQHVGAYQTNYKDKAITFIDTPGHAAFNKMRARGAQVTDIIILVVSAADGVQPQTVESIRHIKSAGVPFIVAINKIDLPGAIPQKIKSELSEQQVFVEGYGGQVPFVEISAKTGKGIDSLLEMILLVSEMEELQADPNGELQAVIIESNLDKTQGPMATVIVKQGNLVSGQVVYLDAESFKIRQLLDENHKILKEAGPSRPAQLFGFKAVPPVGALLTGSPREPQPVLTPAKVEVAPVVSEEGAEVIELPHFNLILKADTAGTLEAILQSVLQDEITLIDKGIGPITEADILLASDTGAVIIGFNIPVTGNAVKLAETELVKIKTFSIIYELIEFLEKKVLELLEPSIYEETMGTAQVIQVFAIKGATIAGCKVVSGRLQKNDRIHLLHRDKLTGDGRIGSLKQGKTDIKICKAGEECGVVCEPSFDFRTGDVIKSYRIIEK
jgi:translation initiation factor IF-2